MKKHFFITPYDQQEKLVRVLLPKGYDKSDKSYPVLYMHDGQNLFYRKESYADSTWGVRSALKKKEIILVGLDHSPQRFQEYIPFRRPLPDSPENYGNLYLQWLVNELKPFIDKNYRTLSDREHTYIAGSSLGGLISAYAIARHQDTFSKAGIFSLALIGYDEEMESFMQQYPLGAGSHLFLQVGTNEVFDYESESLNIEASQAYLDNSIYYMIKLVEWGLPSSNLFFTIDIDARHEEEAWRKSFPKFIRFLNQ